MEDVDEDEEQLVLVELSGIIDHDFLQKPENKCRIIGLDTDKPVMQIGHYFFSGNYEDEIGTAAIFEEAKPNEENHVPGELKLTAITRKSLCMKRTFLNKKIESDQSLDQKNKDAPEDGNSQNWAMSTTAKIVFITSVATTIGIIVTVHYRQDAERFRMHQGVIRDVERQQRRKIQNTHQLQQQIEIEKHLKSSLDGKTDH